MLPKFVHSESHSSPIRMRLKWFEFSESHSRITFIIDSENINFILSHPNRVHIDSEWTNFGSINYDTRNQRTQGPKFEKVILGGSPRSQY
jgi:hypothetical protein